MGFSLHQRRAYKTVDDEDLKFPLIYGEGKKVGFRTSAVRFRHEGDGLTR